MCHIYYNACLQPCRLLLLSTLLILRNSKNVLFYVDFNLICLLNPSSLVVNRVSPYCKEFNTYGLKAIKSINKSFDLEKKTVVFFHDDPVNSTFQ